MKNKAEKRNIFRPFDFVIIGAAALLALLTFFLIPQTGKTVTVCVNGETVFKGSLDTNAVFTTPDGRNEITIKNGKVYMSNAACPDKTCVHMGFATPAKPIVCLPNGVIITVSGGEETDSVTW